MKITKKALLYDIANIAFAVADSGDPANHDLHRVRDICQEGNIDRVSRVLGLAYADILSVLIPVLASPPDFSKTYDHDFTSRPHDYEFFFSEETRGKFALAPEHKLKIKERAREYMVAMVLADWLSITLPEAASAWKDRAKLCLESLKESVAGILIRSVSSGAFRRKICPF